MAQKQLSRTFMMISNLKKLRYFGLYTNISALEGLIPSLYIIKTYMYIPKSFTGLVIE